MNRKSIFLLIAASFLTLASASMVVAYQRGYGWGGYSGRRGTIQSGNRAGVPLWEIDQDFKNDVFVFARVQFSDGYGGRRGKWATDYPDSDLNFSLRLQQLTSMKVDPEPVIRLLTDEDLFDFPFLYMIEPGNMLLDEAEVLGLRKYLDNGGFMMVDDFWGVDEYFNFYTQMKKVFPEKEPTEVPLEHEIFHCVYDLKEKPQVPSIHAFYSGSSYEGRYGSDTSKASYRAIYDDEGRIMVFICHNTDLGDGWEREGENHEYFQEYAVKKSYPLGINIVTYAMTH